MYQINSNYAKELKGGIRNTYLAKQLGVTEGFISSIFKGKKDCSKIIAKAIISIRLNAAIDSVMVDEAIEKFFIKK